MLYTIFYKLFNYEFSLPNKRIASKSFDCEIGIEMINYYYDNNKNYYGTYEIV